MCCLSYTHVAPTVLWSRCLSYNGPGPDYCVVADPDWEEGSVCPDAHVIAKLRLAPEAPFRRRVSGNEGIIDKHGPVRNEAIIPEGDQLTGERVRLNTTALTYFRSFLYLDKRPTKVPSLIAQP
jgi:hypothetical protein